MKKIFFTVFVFAFTGTTLFPQQSKVIDRIIEIGQTDNRTMDHLDVLCNRFGGRLVGSDAYEMRQSGVPRNSEAGVWK